MREATCKAFFASSHQATKNDPEKTWPQALKGKSQWSCCKAWDLASIVRRFTWIVLHRFTWTTVFVERFGIADVMSAVHICLPLQKTTWVKIKRTAKEFRVFTCLLRYSRAHKGIMGSRALSHDSIFIPEIGQESARPVRVFSQENVSDRIRALQVICTMYFFQTQPECPPRLDFFYNVYSWILH